MEKLFGTSGIRGDAESLLTNQFVFDVARSFAIFLKNKNLNGPVAVGMDPRESSPRILKATISGLVSEGLESKNEGVTSIPSMAYVLYANPEIVGSIMITGSHIKSNLNGIKFFFNKNEVLKDDEKEMEKIYFDIKESKKYEESNLEIEIDNSAREEYKNFLNSLSKTPYPNWKVVIDPGNGAQSEIIPDVLKSFGIDVILINADIQLGILSRDTEVEGEFATLQEKVKSENADFGIAFDSDGDRVVFVDEKGQFVPGDYTGTIIAKEQMGDYIVTPINTSQVIDKIGKKILRTKVGSPQVIAGIKEVKAKFGFEANGGGIFSVLPTRDGGHSAIEVMNILKKSGKKLSELVSELPKFYIERDKVDYNPSLKEEIVKKAKEVFHGIKTEEMDGVKIWLTEDSWILFRASGNAAEFRVFVETPSLSKSKELLKEGMELVKSFT